MAHLKVALGEVKIFLRHSQSLKDKRRVLQGLIQKLRNAGFSVTEADFQDNPKRASIAFVFAAKDTSAAQMALREVDKALMGDFEILDRRREILDYPENTEIAVDWDSVTEDP